MDVDAVSTIPRVTSGITPLVLTYNEAPNIDRTLAKLRWASRVVVVDSFSTDETEAICARYPNVDLKRRRFDSHAEQWNWGLDQVQSDWVLSLDADYVLSDELITELTGLVLTDRTAGFYARFAYCVFGKQLRGSLYPPRVVLFRPATCRYVQDGHTQRLQVGGEVGWLSALIQHDDRKPIDRWIADQLRYAALEAKHLSATPRSELSWPDRMRSSAVLAPAVVFLYTLFGQRLVLDAWPGFYYVLQRTCAELMLSLRLVEARVRKSQPNS
jgi:glycosyltransferase involved in cell wall biosynthesis